MTMVNWMYQHREGDPMSKTIDRIAALLAQAEGTSNEAEADAYMAKAQKLASLAAIDLEVARQRQKDKTTREQPVQRQITIAGFVGGSGYSRGSRVQNNAAEMCRLFMDIGYVNDLQFDVSMKSLYVVAYGMPSDIDVTEALYTSLLMQMTGAAEAAIKAGVHKQEEGERVWDYRRCEFRAVRPDARRFKTAFYRAFTGRVLARLQEAKREAVEQVEQVREQEAATLPAVASTETALVLREKAEEVKAYRAATTDAKGTWRGGARSSGSSAGKRAGRAAGDSARLGAQTALPAARKKLP
jgi:hypothetical protein